MHPASLSLQTCTTRASCLSRSARRKSRCVPSAAVSPSSRLRSGAGAAPTRACPRSNSPSRRRSTRSFLWSCRRCPCRGLSPASARPAPTASPSSAMARRSGRACLPHRALPSPRGHLPLARDIDPAASSPPRRDCRSRPPSDPSLVTRGRRRSYLSTLLQRVDGLGEKLHVLFVAAAFLWPRQITIDVDACRMLIV